MATSRQDKVATVLAHTRSERPRVLGSGAQPAWEGRSFVPPPRPVTHPAQCASAPGCLASGTAQAPQEGEATQLPQQEASPWPPPPC